jgi:uncharacterized protein YcfJ
MRNGVKLVGVTAAMLILAGCVTPPLGPTVRAIPSRDVSFDQFQRDRYECEDFASREVAGGAEAANRRAVGTAVVGTAIGAAIGAATGGGRSTAKGAAIGGAVGTVAGAHQSAHAQHDLQHLYNVAYADCMSAKGHRVPSYGPPPGYGPPPDYPPPPPGY